MRIPSGVVDQYIYFVAVDLADFQTRETGLTGFTVYRVRDGGAPAAMTTPTINEVDSTNMPGVYELLLDEDMTIDSGNYTEAMAFHIEQASMLAVTKEIELFSPTQQAGAVWDEATSDHNVGGSFGKGLRQIKEGFINIEGTVNDASATTTSFITDLVNSTTSFYSDQTLIFIDGNLAGQSRIITNYNGTTKTVTFDEAFSEAPADSDAFVILTLHTHTVTSVAETVRAEIDSNSTQLAAIKTKTDSLTFTKANEVDSNVQSVNSVTIVGDGSGTPFDV